MKQLTWLAPGKPVESYAEFLSLADRIVTEDRWEAILDKLAALAAAGSVRAAELLFRIQFRMSELASVKGSQPPSFIELGNAVSRIAE